LATHKKKPPLPWLKPALLLGGLSPLVLFLLRAARGTLSADPVAELLNQLGRLALIFLIASLVCTPLKTLAGWTWPIRVRRMLGVLSFVYALLHFLTYAVVDQGLALKVILEDISKRGFILVGFLAFLLLIPLTVTSTDGMVKRLGYARWKRLHQLAYVAGALGVTHFVLRVKADVSVPATYGVLLALLLGIRVVTWVRKRSPHPVR
jgi:methionine sulfoxide reductase heme-binding subunit